MMNLCANDIILLCLSTDCDRLFGANLQLKGQLYELEYVHPGLALYFCLDQKNFS